MMKEAFMSLSDFVDSMAVKYANHDKHYAQMAIQPIDVQEQILRSENGMDAVQKHHICEAVAYIMRAGLKEGQDWRKDLDKARNYLHRASTGEWQ